MKTEFLLVAIVEFVGENDIFECEFKRDRYLNKNLDYTLSKGYVNDFMPGADVMSLQEIKQNFIGWLKSKGDFHLVKRIKFKFVKA